MDKLLKIIGTTTDPIAKGLITKEDKIKTVQNVFQDLQSVDPAMITPEYPKMLGVLRSLCREKMGSECYFEQQVSTLIRM